MTMELHLNSTALRFMGLKSASKIRVMCFFKSCVKNVQVESHQRLGVFFGILFLLLKFGLD